MLEDFYRRRRQMIDKLIPGCRRPGFESPLAQAMTAELRAAGVPMRQLLRDAAGNTYMLATAWSETWIVDGSDLPTR